MWDWYKIYNLKKMREETLPQVYLKVNLKNLGLKEVMITYSTVSKLFSVLFDKTILTPRLNNRNGFDFKKRSAYIDDNDDLWIGIKNEDSIQ